MSTFLDTNVVVYAFDRADPEKRARAIAILEEGKRLVVSTQILLETWWVLTRRLAEPLGEEEASMVIETLTQLPVVKNADRYLGRDDHRGRAGGRLQPSSQRESPARPRLRRCGRRESV